MTTLTEIQTKTIKAIVRIFETGKITPDYGRIGWDSNGGISYGICQASRNSGNLAKIVHFYCEHKDARFANQLRNYLVQCDARERNLDFNTAFKAFLTEAGRDPVMAEIQEQFFDENFFIPAFRYAQQIGLYEVLSIAVMYDSTVHGSRQRLVEKTNTYSGRIAAIGEHSWIGDYVFRRRAWLIDCGGILAKTIYRMDTFEGLIQAQNWDLDLPITAHGITIKGA